VVARDPRGDPAVEGPAFYHLFAENAQTEYLAYVSEQNLLPDTSGEPLRSAQVSDIFERKRVRRLPAEG
jgi:heat shock protein HspQ